MKFAQHLFAFLMGYFIYSLIEIINRGYTHWTMALTGGLILTILYALNNIKTMTLIKSCFIGSVIITAIEFIVGVFDNIIMHWNVWDYSGMPFNVSGQICLLFSCYWFLLCIPAYYLCRIMRKKFTAERQIS
ncbi:MAG: putative ABC transporter permease [Ruminococcus flavefaciens]|nr:putative ABC transporter permease [Ruminococcus flavefaciens]